MFNRLRQLAHHLCGKRPAAKTLWATTPHANCSTQRMLALLTTGSLFAVSNAESISFLTDDGQNAYVASSQRKFLISLMSQLAKECGVELSNIARKTGKTPFSVFACNSDISITGLHGANNSSAGIQCVINYLDYACKDWNIEIMVILLLVIILATTIVLFQKPTKHFTNVERYENIVTRLEECKKHPNSETPNLLSFTQDVMQLIEDSYTDPISRNIMNRPVCAISGITYDEETLEDLLNNSGKCPMTNYRLPNKIPKPTECLQRNLDGFLSIGEKNLEIMEKKNNHYKPLLRK